MWSVWSLIAVMPLDLHRDVTAQQGVRCWPLWPCAYNSGRTYVAPSSLFVRITSHWCGCSSRTQRVWWPGGYMLYNSSSSQLSTGPVGIMVMRTASREFPHHCADNVLARTAHRLMWLPSRLISPLILSRPVARRTLIWSPYTQERTGWRYWTMTCHNRLQFPVIPSRSLPSRKKTQSASRSGRGLRQVISHRGLRSRV